MEGITSSSVSDLISVYPLHVDRIPVAVTGWGCSHPPPTMSLGVREPERPTGVALTLSDPLASHLYDSHIPRRQAQRVMHNPLHHHRHTEGPWVQVRHPQVCPQVCCNVTFALSIRRNSRRLLLLFSPSLFLTRVQPSLIKLLF